MVNQITEVTPNKPIQVMSLDFGKWSKMMEISRRVYSEFGIAPTIHTCGGGNTEPKVLVRARK